MNSGRFEQGHVPYNKGVPMTKEDRERHQAYWDSRKGMKFSEETKKKMRRKPWNKGLTKKTDERVKAYGEKQRGKKRRKLTKEHIKKALRRRIPSSLEDKFLRICQDCNLPFKYTGDGRFFIENCNPDFVNCNGKKVAIEVYARHFKQLDGRNIERWKRERSKIFAKYGWKLIFFDETQVNKEEVFKTLEGNHGYRN